MPSKLDQTCHDIAETSTGKNKVGLYRRSLLAVSHVLLAIFCVLSRACDNHIQPQRQCLGTRFCLWWWHPGQPISVQEFMQGAPESVAMRFGISLQKLAQFLLCPGHPLLRVVHLVAFPPVDRVFTSTHVFWCQVVLQRRVPKGQQAWVFERG